MYGEVLEDIEHFITSQHFNFQYFDRVTGCASTFLRSVTVGATAPNIDYFGHHRRERPIEPDLLLFDLDRDSLCSDMTPFRESNVPK